MNIKTIQDYKSIPKGIEFSLPDFTVLTGRNGSGKTHLLEAMANPKLTKISNNNIMYSNIKYIGFNGLNPKIDEQCDRNTIVQNIRGIWEQVDQIIQQYKNEQRNRMSPQTLDIKYLKSHIRDIKIHKAIQGVLFRSKKELIDIDEEDISKYLDFVEFADPNLFASQFALIFKAYHNRFDKNCYARYRRDILKDKYAEPLSDMEFLSQFGPPPWETINSLLEKACLPYRTNSPLEIDSDCVYKIKLTDSTRNLEISVNDLSTGERVLMSLALAIYNSTECKEIPDLLLIDEPDAALHPEFSNLLVKTIQEIIVNKAGVKVIISTHSPSTVACCPSGSIFEIDKSVKLPVSITTKKAISVLTTGLPNLRITNDDRRQVFVESKYDVSYYENLFNIISRNKPFQISPLFLAPHGRNGSNCSDVMDIVSQLGNKGNDLVWGIIDYDMKNTSKERIVVLGKGSRYAIENYVFEPIFCALLLIREKYQSFTDFGLVNYTTYIEATKLSEPEVQNVTNALLEKIGLNAGTQIKSTMLNGFCIDLPEAFRYCQGHELEDKLLKVFPQLNAIKRGKTEENILKDYVIDTVISDYHCFLSLDIIETINMIK